MAESPRTDRRRRWIGALLLGYWIALFVGTHIPLDMPPGGGNADKLAHFAAYAGLACLLLLWLAAETGVRAWHAGVVLTVALVYGAADELTQLLVGRDAEWLDWLADGGGALVGILVAVLLLRLPGVRAGSPSSRG